MLITYSSVEYSCNYFLLQQNYHTIGYVIKNYRSVSSQYVYEYVLPKDIKYNFIEFEIHRNKFKLRLSDYIPSAEIHFSGVRVL